MNKNKLLSLIITLGGCIALASSCFWGFSSDSSPNESIMESSSEETYSYENESSSIEESFSSEKMSMSTISFLTLRPQHVQKQA